MTPGGRGLGVDAGEGPFFPETILITPTLLDEKTQAECRRVASAALGAIGDRSGLESILRATQDRPAVRRRAVIALAPFEGPEVDAALARALGDRDWQVRQAAEDLTRG